MSGRPKTTWGGVRSNSGRKRQKTTVSERTQKKWLQAANKFAKKHGMTVEEAILDMIMDPDVQDSVKVACAKLYNEALIVRQPAIEMSGPALGPVVGLPPLRPDPALMVVRDRD